MNFTKIYALILMLLPNIVMANGNWQVIDTAGTESATDPAYICLVMPKNFTASDTVFKDMMVMHRRGNKYPMVKFATFDKGAYSFKYIIDQQSVPEIVKEIVANKKGSLFINDQEALEFIENLKKGEQLRYLISSNNKEYKTRAVSLNGFAKTFNSINSCKK